MEGNQPPPTPPTRPVMSFGGSRSAAQQACSRNVKPRPAAQQEIRRDAARVDQMSPAAAQAQRDRHLAENMTPAQREAHRQANVAENMTPAQREAHRQANVAENMTPAQLEAHRLANRPEGMSGPRLAAHRAGDRVAGMSDDHHDAHNVRTAAARNAKVSIAQKWDYAHPCSHCGCIWLESNSAKSRMLCCQGGLWASPQMIGDNRKCSQGYFPELEQLPDAIRDLSIANANHFTTRSGFYNNLFSTAVTGVDNGRPGVGYEEFNMQAAVKLNGRTYHRFPDSTMNSCGMANFVHDGLSAHVRGVNSRARSADGELKLFPDYVNLLAEELKEINPYLKDFAAIGAAIMELEGEEPIPIYNSSLSVQTHRLEVGILLNQDAGRGVVYQYKTIGNKTDFADANSRQVEPLCYPLLFPNGELGWGAELKRHKIQLMPYLAARLLQPEMKDLNDPPDLTSVKALDCLRVWNKFGTHQQYVNRFQCMSRLSQYWLVEGTTAH